MSTNGTGHRVLFSDVNSSPRALVLDNDNRWPEFLLDYYNLTVMGSETEVLLQDRSQAGLCLGIGLAALVSVLVVVLYFQSCFQHCCAHCVAKRWTNNQFFDFLHEVTFYNKRACCKTRVFFRLCRRTSYLLAQA